MEQAIRDCLREAREALRSAVSGQQRAELERLHVDACVQACEGRGRLSSGVRAALASEATQVGWHRQNLSLFLEAVMPKCRAQLPPQGTDF